MAVTSLAPMTIEIKEKAMKKSSAFLFACLITVVNACGSFSGPAAKPGRVTHIVICWLKDSGNTKQRQQIEAVSKSFAEIPGILDIVVGSTLPSERPVVDTSFDIAIVMTFENQQALKNYLNHPNHKIATRETLKPLAEKIIVYDFINQ